MELFKSLINGNVNSREVLKNQISFKSDLREIRKRNPDFKLEEQISVIQKIAQLVYITHEIYSTFDCNRSLEVRCDLLMIMV